MNRTKPNKFKNQHNNALAETEKEILLVYDLIKTNGIILPPGIIDKQIEVLKGQTVSPTGIKYLFTCC